jgi:hypothetical protein
MTLTAVVVAEFCSSASLGYLSSVQPPPVDQSPDKNAQLVPWIPSSIKKTNVADRTVETRRALGPLGAAIRDHLR